VANPENVETVRQGAEAIDKWRAQNPGTRLDLSSAELRLAEYRSAYQVNAILSNASLTEPDLSKEELLHALNSDDGLLHLLINHIESYSIKEKRVKNSIASTGGVVKWIFGKIIGADLIHSGRIFKSNVEQWQNNERKYFPASEGIEFLVASIVRFIRVGFITLLLALIPFVIQVSQIAVMMQQNSKIQSQIDQQAAERKSADRNRLIEIIYQEEDGNKLNRNDLEKSITRTYNRRIPKANFRSRQEAVLAFIKSEYESNAKPFYLDLSYGLLSEILFDHYEFKKAGMDDALVGSIFLNANLENSRFFESNLQKSVFNNAYLKDAYFRNAHLEEAFFWGADLSGVYFGGAHLDNAHFADAIVDSANWIEELRKVKPPVTGFDFNFWSVEKTTTDNGVEIFRLRAPVGSDENHMRSFEIKK
tara:strand:+ start:112193 stop:113452 length:1260 start_codon:yes stop_codon:yes gene_type:complete